MSVIEQRIKGYDRFVRLPWQRGLSGSEKVWMVIYPPSEERRLRRRMPEFALATTGAGHTWKNIDLTRFFAQWMADNDYREQYFKAPQSIQLALGDFETSLADRVKEVTATQAASNVGLPLESPPSRLVAHSGSPPATSTHHHIPRPPQTQDALLTSNTFAQSLVMRSSRRRRVRHAAARWAARRTNPMRTPSTRLPRSKAWRQHPMRRTSGSTPRISGSKPSRSSRW